VVSPTVATFWHTGGVTHPEFISFNFGNFFEPQIGISTYLEGHPVKWFNVV